MSNTLTNLGANVVLDWDIRKNTWLDQSGNNNNASVSNGVPYYKNTQLGRGMYFPSTATIQVADSPELQLTNGVILVFGDFTNATPNGRFVSKRDAGGTNYSFSLNPTGTDLQFFDGTLGSIITADIVGKNMLAVKFVASGVPTFYMDGVNIGNGSISLSISVDDAPISIGNFYLNTLGAENNLTKIVIIDDSTVVTDAQITAIYNEYMLERGALHIPRRGYLNPQPTDDDPTLEYHYDMKTLNSDGELVDLSGNGRDGIKSGLLGSVSSVFDRGLDFSGLGYVTIPYVNIGTDLTYEFWIKRTGGVNAQLFSFMATLFRIEPTVWRWFPNTSAPSKTIPAPTATNKWHQVIVTQTGTTFFAYLNNVQVDTGTVAGISNINVSSNFIGRFSSTIGIDAMIGSVKVFSSVISAEKRTELYEQGARKLYFYQSMEDVPPTISNVTTDKIPLTEFSVNTGTWAVEEDSTGKYLSCVGSGQIQSELVEADGMATRTFTVSGSPTLTKNATNLQIDAVAGEKIYNIVLING